MVTALDVRNMPLLAMPIILVNLLATGWAANHFTALIPALADTQGFSRTILNSAFGIYALGLLPGLLGGGGLSDRIGRRTLVMCGAAIAGLGNLVLLTQPDQIGLYLGRLVVGVGVGLTMSAGTAWAADIGGNRGAIAAGVALSAGFGLGPLVSGLISQFTHEAVAAPYAVAVTLSTVSGLLAWRLRIPVNRYENRTEIPPPDDTHRGVALTLKAAVPMAMWVFSCASAAMVVMAARMGDRYSGPWLPGMAAAVTLGTGAVVQILARRANLGPHAGVAGAVLAALGFCLAAVVGSTPTMTIFLLTTVLLGSGYGLCLREGLIDIETLAPSSARGILIGVFYVSAYLGLELPILLTVIRPLAGVTAPLLVLGCFATVSAIYRVVHIAGNHRPAR